MRTTRARTATLLAGPAVAGLLVAVVAADLAREPATDASSAVGPDVTATDTVRPAPVLAAGGDGPGATLSRAVALLTLPGPAGDVAGGLLGTWGAVQLGAAGEGEALPATDPRVDDVRLLGVPIPPAFTDPCAVEPGRPGCPDPDEVVPAVVVGERPLGPNAVVIHAFPRPDAELAAECAFEDVAAGELPLAIATANPGRLAVAVGDQNYVDEAAAAEVAEFEAWRDAGGELPRPASSFVAHCLAVPRPTTPGPIHVRVLAVDEAEQAARAETIVLPSPPGLPGATLTPIDGTMVRVDVPLAATGGATVTAGPPPAAETSSAAPAPACATPPSGPVAGWRHGSSTVLEAPAGATASYLEAAPRVLRAAVPLQEGEPNLLCIAHDGDADPVGLVVIPPDARRLTLAVLEVEAPAGVGDDELVVLGTFAELGWTPCAAVFDDVPTGNLESGPGGLLCESGGDTGAIAAAGGVLDLALGVGDGLHLARIVLSAEPGGDPSETYRLPIPAADLDGVLCTEGVEQPGCVPPEGDAVLGTVTIRATWDEGPTGPATWTVLAV